MTNGFAISSAAVSDRGLSDKRPQNEDSFLEIASKGIFAVADGVGGAQAGEVASQMAMEILGEAFTNMAAGADAEETMHLALVQANAAIHQMSRELPQLAQMATTVVALHLNGKVATIGHAGDSRLYRLDSSGRLHRETEDHSMVADEVRAGRMTEEQAENHPAKNVINRALGAEPAVDLELRTVIVDESSTWLLCSDGVTRHIPDSELAALLTSESPEGACRRIKELCYSRGAEDNLTAVIVRAEAASSESKAPTEGEEDEDDATVASPRPAAPVEPDDDDDLLELDTKELFHPTSAAAQDPITAVNAPPPALIEVPESEPVLVEPPAADEPSLAPSEPPTTDAARPLPAKEVDDRPMFGMASGVEPERQSSGSKTLWAAIGSLVLGSLIGLAVYHYLLVPPAAPTTNSLTEMRAQNVPQTTFEENRRTVDKDPALYVSRAGVPQDAEDHYLLGRAYLLTGDFLKARSSFVEARTIIDGGDQSRAADPANAQVIKDDIALALTVINDTTVQGLLRKELESARGLPAGSMSNANTNR